MAENVLQTAQQFFQDVIAPDVREIKVRIEALEKEIVSAQKQQVESAKILEKQQDERFRAAEKQQDERFKAVDERFKAADKRQDERFQAVDEHFKAAEAANQARHEALMSAIRESRAQAELTSMRVIANLTERVVLLEAQQRSR